MANVRSGEGVTDLATLLAELEPELDPQPYRFETVPPAAAEAYLDRAIGWFRETEGITLIITAAPERAAQQPQTCFARITLRVHSSLNAVGLTASVAARLASHNLPANVVAGYFHDHLFVPFGERERALALLRQPWPTDAAFAHPAD